MGFINKNAVACELYTALQGKKVLVLGAGACGVSAAKFLRERGAVVGVFDDGEGGYIKEAIYVKGEAQVDAEHFDFCVISPGVSMHHAVAKKFVGSSCAGDCKPEDSMTLISELALGFTSSHKKIVAVTGTNGKTTVTNMIGVALGKRGVVCGNVGVPVTSISSEIAKKIAVAEVSSFMLEPDCGFRADIGVVLNITQDHLERHGTLEEYIRCKAKLAKSGKVVLNYDDLNCRTLNDGRAFYFSTKSVVHGIYLDGNDIVLNIKRRRVIFQLGDFGEDRPHQISNILAVILVCKLLGVKRERILEACKGGQAREHRIQQVGEMGNIIFVNDSKATNIAATLAACLCFQSPVNLLVGGMLKGQKFDELFVNLPAHVDHVFAFGQGAGEVFEAAVRCDFKEITQYCSMGEAVKAAACHGLGPRVVLLSPACSSFDEFNGYADRGRAFTEMVREIANDKS